MKCLKTAATRTPSLEGGVADEGRNGSRNVNRAEEGHDGDHGETSVVQFRDPLPLQGGRIDVGEIDGGEDHAGHVPALHVMSTLGFRDQLRDEDGE